MKTAKTAKTASLPTILTLPASCAASWSRVVKASASAKKANEAFDFALANFAADLGEVEGGSARWISAYAAQNGLDVSKSRVQNALTVVALRDAHPETAALGSTVCLRIAEADIAPEDVAEFVAEVVASGGKVADVKAAVDARDGRSASEKHADSLDSFVIRTALGIVALCKSAKAVSECIAAIEEAVGFAQAKAK